MSRTLLATLASFVRKRLGTYELVSMGAGVRAEGEDLVSQFLSRRATRTIKALLAKIL
jgi:hypothetical protein